MKSDPSVPENRYRLTIEIPGLPKGLNGSHGDYRFASIQKKKWRNASALLASLSPKPPSPLTRAGLIFTRYSSRPMDYDNRVASAKQVIDGLTQAGIILDDSDKVILKREYLEIKCKRGEEKITLEVYEILDQDLNLCLMCGK